ncbi:DUF192 domain-containing protein [Tsuneonella mangrovi]|uniref:DUF192 domain-containing protein n=1 Tax=Tsuneonella mangrovi TaxID=1982042 RepID=UPI001F0A7344|nr:DUF192 domain-containing protein [Tsuneonella mangrovi]
MIRPTIIAAMAALLVACSHQPAAEAAPAATPAVNPESGLPVIALTVTTPKGTHSFRVEVASTPEQEARGLMFRTKLGPDEGMIFPRDPQDVPSFWMKNTPLPLDIIFIGTDHRILNISANTEPYSLTPVSAIGMCSAVLEIPGGRAAALGIGPGAKVEW